MIEYLNSKGKTAQVPVPVNALRKNTGTGSPKVSTK